MVTFDKIKRNQIKMADVELVAWSKQYHRNWTSTTVWKQIPSFYYLIPVGQYHFAFSVFFKIQTAMSSGKNPAGLGRWWHPLKKNGVRHFLQITHRNEFLYLDRHGRCWAWTWRNYKGFFTYVWYIKWPLSFFGWTFSPEY